jgi:uncharacterized protein
MNRVALTGIAIASLGLVASAWLLGNGIRKRGIIEAVEVTGMAEKNFSSDLIVWRGNFSKLNLNLKEAYKQLKEDEQKVRTYLKSKGIQEKEVIFSAVNIDQEYNYSYYGGQNHREFLGYKLTQTVRVETGDVDRLEAISREVTELIDQGIELNSNSPEYFYTKLADLKLDLIRNATDDARNRAMKIAEAAGSGLGKLRTANLGVFQITGKYSSEEFEWGGAFNTSSREKTARVTVRLNYHTR